MAYKNNLLVYKVELCLKVDSPNTVKILAAERQSTADIEVQAWNTAEGNVTLSTRKKPCILQNFKCFFSISLWGWEDNIF